MSTVRKMLGFPRHTALSNTSIKTGGYLGLIKSWDFARTMEQTHPQEERDKKTEDLTTHRFKCLYDEQSSLVQAVSYRKSEVEDMTG